MSSISEIAKYTGNVTAGLAFAGAGVAALGQVGRYIYNGQEMDPQGILQTRTGRALGVAATLTGTALVLDGISFLKDPSQDLDLKATYGALILNTSIKVLIPIAKVTVSVTASAIVGAASASFSLFSSMFG